MPLTIPPETGIAAVRFSYSGDLEEMVCTLGVRASAPPVLEAHASRIESAWRTHILPVQSAVVRLVGVTIRVQEEVEGTRIVEWLSPAASLGGQTGESFPQNTAFLVEKHTGQGGRRNVGRMFIPGVPESGANSAGVIGSTTATSWATRLNDFLAALAAATGTPAGTEPVVPLILHGNATTTTRTTGPGSTTVTVTEGAAGPLPTVITSLRLDPLVATQRRRLR